MDRTISLLCFAMLVILRSCGGSDSRRSVASLLEAIQNDWGSYSLIPSHGELRKCIQTLEHLNNSYSESTGAGRIVISAVCNRTISQGSLVSSICSLSLLIIIFAILVLLFLLFSGT